MRLRLIFERILVLALVASCRGEPTGSERPGRAATPSREEQRGEGLPRFIQADYIELGKIARISKFRSGVGHDYSDEVEHCRSMKHYFVPRADVDWSGVRLASPVNGTVAELREEWAGTQVRIQPDEAPDFEVVLFHVHLAQPLARGEHVAAGQPLGMHVGAQTFSDIAVEARTRGGRRLVSYFDVLPGSLFQAYQARGIATRAALIIPQAERDARPLRCAENGSFGPEGADDWVALNP